MHRFLLCDTQPIPYFPVDVVMLPTMAKVGIAFGSGDCRVDTAVVDAGNRFLYPDTNQTLKLMWEELRNTFDAADPSGSMQGQLVYLDIDGPIRDGVDCPKIGRTLCHALLHESDLFLLDHLRLLSVYQSYQFLLLIVSKHSSRSPAAMFLLAVAVLFFVSTMFLLMKFLVV